MTKEDTAAQLNGLIEVCKDGENGYNTVAGHVHNTELRTVFEGYAKQRAQFSRALQAEVERLGGSPVNSGTLTGAMYRGWIDLKAIVTGGDPGAIAAVCENGEDSAQAAFERVVNTDISGESRTLIEGQWRKIQEAHSRMAGLKEQISSGTEYPKND